MFENGVLIDKNVYIVEKIVNGVVGVNLMKVEFSGVKNVINFKD